MSCLVSAALALAISLAPLIASAGECTNPDEDYLRLLERGAGIVVSIPLPSPREVSAALSCLAYSRIDIGRWAGPRTASFFTSLHHSPFRERFVAACTPYLLGRTEATREDPEIAFEAATALAMYGVDEAGGQDIFRILTQGDPRDRTRLPYFAMASLADPRTLPFLRARYDSLASAPPARNTQFWKTQLVNCLYHLPGDSVVTFAEEIAAADPDTAVVARARHVVEARRAH